MIQYYGDLSTKFFFTAWQYIGEVGLIFEEELRLPGVRGGTMSKIIALTHFSRILAALLIMAGGY